ncbi:unnamed protein product [Vitrella brassicaformis CCMP3155]|uniref:Aminotransferase class V domain-containing protein n=1 Tax=Vitrella brassicaformis (strain CCMP3155) TaxID=1169540 RepID=A0A0G4EYI0_VITBC|nr:unnamed protein product [Vitrella brassicaformis CCMP3155]|eukprot:CEM04103.1 unnamed protein product [Vitrella brassicaformis CCMP3155]
MATMCWSAEDIARARSDTPGLHSSHRRGAGIHLNAAGSSLLPSTVTDTVVSYLREEALRGGYETADAHEAEISDVYEAIGEMLHCESSEVALSESATVSWDSAFFSLPWADGDRVCIGKAEYASNAIAILNLKQRKNIEVVEIADDSSGQFDLSALSAALQDDLTAKRRRMTVVSMTHVPTNGGLINDAEWCGRIIEEHNARVAAAGLCRVDGIDSTIFLLDACQSCGQIDLDVRRLKCHFLSVTGRKYLRAPRGTGFLYVTKRLLNRGFLNPMYADLRSASWLGKDQFELASTAKCFELWESSIACRLGLGAAVRYALQIGLPNAEKRIQALASLLRGQLRELPTVTVRDKGGARQGGIVSFTCQSAAGKAIPADRVKSMLSERGVDVSVSSAASTLIDMRERGIDAVVRASVHYYNTEEEMTLFVGVLRDVLENV